MDELIESFSDFEILEAEQIEKRLNRLPYPAISLNGTNLYLNVKATGHIKQDRVEVFKAKIRGEYYLCFRGTDDQRGFVFRHGTNNSISSASILDGIGLPRSVKIHERKCAYIPNGIAMKIN